MAIAATVLIGGSLASLGMTQDAALGMTPPAALGTPRASLSAILIGTGNPRPNIDRAGPSVAIVAGNQWFLVDAGRGATLRIAGTKLNYAQMRAVFITHLHSDHTAGLPDVFTTSWQFGRKTTPLQLYGPEGIQALSNAILQFFAYDIHIRRDLVEHHPAAGATIDTHIVKEGVVYDDGDVRVTAFKENHAPVEPAFGYRFDSRRQSIVVSGDTRPNANLVKFAKGADVLIIESYLPGFFRTVDTPEVAAKLESYHTSAIEAGEIARDAAVKTLVFTHLMPPGPDAANITNASKSFHGRIVVGSDLKTITINGDNNESHSR